MQTRYNLPASIGLPALLSLLWMLSTSVQAQDYRGFKVGSYQGQVHNKTGGNTGKGTLKVRSIAPDGTVQAHLRDSDGLEGEGLLTGAINANGVMQLTGVMTSPSNGSRWQSALIAVMQNGQIRMGNTLTLGNTVEEETAMMAFTPTTAPVKANTTPPMKTLTGIGAAYGARNPRTCASTKAPVSGPLSAQQATQYVICGYEMEAQLVDLCLYLVDNIKLELGSSRPYQPRTDSFADIDVRSPIYPIRGSYTTYTINRLYTGPEPRWQNTGKNCNISQNRLFTGVCYRTTFGDWSCVTSGVGSGHPDIANTAPPQ